MRSDKTSAAVLEFSGGVGVTRGMVIMPPGVGVTVGVPDGRQTRGVGEGAGIGAGVGVGYVGRSVLVMTIG